jgi:hypothetical protein
MDADLYNPLKADLHTSTLLLSPGGTTLVQDYKYKWEGLIKAVDEFAATIPESLALFPYVNLTVMIFKNKSCTEQADLFGYFGA